VPPPIQGIGNSGGFTMQILVKDGSFDYAMLEKAALAMATRGETQSVLQHLISPFRAGVPQVQIAIDRIKAETLGVTVGQVFSALVGYVGSSYVSQFNRFGRSFQVYVQADSKYRLRPEDLTQLKVKAGNGTMVPLGTLIDVKTVIGPTLVSLYNLYPTAALIGAAADGFSSGQALSVMEQVAAQTLPSNMGYAWTAMSYQEKAVGMQIYFVLALTLLLVYFVLAGQYESWILPLSVLLAVPLALLGVVAAFGLVEAAGIGGLANNLYVQIGLILLIALSSKNAILIVEFAREKCANGEAATTAAVAAARLRFRPILMTSFAFILGVLPLVLATGASASARQSLGIAVFSGMLASTFLAVLFVETWLKGDNMTVAADKGGAAPAA
jgi:hydrophobic/amphiphilic exporter-1 (mainly G- bacteria), HAE1 family